MQTYRPNIFVPIFSLMLASPAFGQSTSARVELLTFENPSDVVRDDRETDKPLPQVSTSYDSNAQTVLSRTFEKQDLKKLVLRRSFEQQGRGVSARSAGTSELRAGGCLNTPMPIKLKLGFAARKRRIMYFPLVREAACRHGIPVGLFDSLVLQESRYNPRARSVKNAFGMTQLMPGTAKELGVDPYDIRQNIEGGARYFAQQRMKFRSDSLALAAYNSGPGRVARLGRIPNIKETKNYVHVILKSWRDSLRIAVNGRQLPDHSNVRKNNVRKVMMIQ